MNAFTGYAYNEDRKGTFLSQRFHVFTNVHAVIFHKTTILVLMTVRIFFYEVR